MNVVLALLFVAFVGAIGGLGYAILTYQGFVRPTPEKQTIIVGPEGSTREIEVEIWMPGVLGHVFIGMLSGVLVFCVFSAPTIPLTWSGTLSLTFYMLGTSLLAGLGGSSAIDQLVEKRQWEKVSGAALQVDPEKTRGVVTTGSPVVALRSISQASKL